MNRWTFLVALVAAVPAFAQSGEPGQLTLAPAEPRPGATVEVAYAPGTVLPDDDALDLRARLRTPDRAWPGRSTVTRSVAALERGDDGVYRGRFVLPDSVAFALFAVATTSGDAVDTNLETGWPLMTHSTDGRPTVAAYSERLEDLGSGDFREGARVARAFTEDHPDRVDAWYMLSFYERAAPTGGRDTLAEAARVAAFDRRLADEPRPDLEDAFALTWLAPFGSDVSARWTDRLIEDAPAFPGTVRLRAFRVLDEQRDAPASQRLAALDAIYLEAGAADKVLMDAGDRTAREAGDLEAALEWADRRVAAVPGHRVRVARALARSPLTRAEGVRRLAAEIAALEDGPTDDRPLFATTTGELEAHHRAMVRLRSELGIATAAQGDLEGARVPLEAAWEGLWQSEPLTVLADARRAAGDLEGAAQALARVAADPGAKSRDEVAERGTALVGAAEWALLESAALAASRRWTLAQSEPVRVDRGLEVADATGRRLPVGSALAEEGPTVLVTFAEACGYCVAAAPALEALHEELGGTGARVVVLSQDDPLEDAFFREREMTVPVVYDVDRSVALALGSAGTPHYYVVDRAGMARYVPSLGDVARHLDALEAAD